MKLYELTQSGDDLVFSYRDAPPLEFPSIHVIDYEPPVGWGVANWYIAQGHHAKHSGLDINLNEYPFGDVDLGEPLFITCDGLVAFAGEAPGRYWGNVVITVSIDDDGLIWWRYGHLDRIDVREGQLVQTGDQVGTCGKGYGGRYDAHLHLDCWRGGMLAPNAWLTPVVEWLDPREAWAAAGVAWKWGER